MSALLLMSSWSLPVGFIFVHYYLPAYCRTRFVCLPQWGSAVFPRDKLPIVVATVRAVLARNLQRVHALDSCFTSPRSPARSFLSVAHS